MKHFRDRRRRPLGPLLPLRFGQVARLAALLTVLSAGGPASAEDPVSIAVVIKDHRFSPAEIRVPAGKPVVLKIKNDDPTPEEFESIALRIEKVITSGSEGTVRLHPLDAGRYDFVGEYHSETAKGAIIAE